MAETSWKKSRIKVSRLSPSITKAKFNRYIHILSRINTIIRELITIIVQGSIKCRRVLFFIKRESKLKDYAIFC